MATKEKGFYTLVQGIFIRLNCYKTLKILILSNNKNKYFYIPDLG